MDRMLPVHVKLHLFGVKGGAISEFGGHPRQASIDSTAWDFGVRCGQADDLRYLAVLSRFNA